MRKCALSFILVAAFAFSPVAYAQNSPKADSSRNGAIPRTSDGKPDFSGVWAAPEGQKELDDVSKYFGHIDYFQFGKIQDPPSLTPWAQEQYDYNLDPVKGTNAHGARLELNPRYAHCIPFSPSQLDMGADILSPFKVMQDGAEFVILYENDNMVRQIFADGRDHPKPVEYTWEGHSIGHWENDTLVVDTIGIRDETWVDNDGHVHSKELHMVERIHRVDHDTLQIDMTLEDPKAFAKPWLLHIFRKLRPGWDIREDVRCTQNIKRGVYGGEFEGTQ